MQRSIMVPGVFVPAACHAVGLYSLRERPHSSNGLWTQERIGITEVEGGENLDEIGGSHKFAAG